MRELTQRVDEVRQWKEELIKARRTTIELTTHRVEEKRQYLLLLRAKKVDDEDLKSQEIAFINSLQQENRRQILKEHYQKEEQFKQYLEEERVKKHDEHETTRISRRKSSKRTESTSTNTIEWERKTEVIESLLDESGSAIRIQKFPAKTT